MAQGQAGDGVDIRIVHIVVDKPAPVFSLCGGRARDFAEFGCEAMPSVADRQGVDGGRR